MSHQTASLVLGIMSGTSMDGVDYALCEVSDTNIRLLTHWHKPFPAALGRGLEAAANGRATSHALGQLHHDLGRFYARWARVGLGPRRPAVVGLHGQTVFHRPHRRTPATLQIGEPAWLVEELRVPVVSNFRAADLAAGGQGAPLATLFHAAVFARRGRFVCVNNLGGISNVTALDWRTGARPRVLAFDTGPANVLLDLAMAHYSRGRLRCDRDGNWAARGRANARLVARWLRDGFFRQPPPKSTGRERFGAAFWAKAHRAAAPAGLSRYDTLATLTEFTAASLVLNYRLHLGGVPDHVVLTGGGAANLALVDRVRAGLGTAFPGVEVLTSEALDWPLQAIEPAAFAFLAYRRLRGLPGNLPATTGAARAAQLGQIAVP